MDTLTEIVRNLLVIIIISNFFELLVPDGNIKPFVRFTIGLFILITILSPTLAYIYNNRDFKVNLWDYSVKNFDQEQILTTGETINRQITGSNNNLIKEKVEGQISAMTMLVPGVEDVDIKADLYQDGSIRKLDITVKPMQDVQYRENDVKAFSHSKNSFTQEEQKQISNKITTIINNLYGLKSNHVNIDFEEG